MTHWADDLLDDGSQLEGQIEPRGERRKQAPVFFVQEESVPNRGRKQSTVQEEEILHQSKHLPLEIAQEDFLLPWEEKSVNPNEHDGDSYNLRITVNFDPFCTRKPSLLGIQKKKML